MKGKPYVSTYFSPDREVEKLLCGFIDNTEQTLECAIYSFTLKSMVNALVNAHNRGVDVRVIADREQAWKWYSKINNLKQKLPDRVRISKEEDNPNVEFEIMHNKYMISDNNAVMVGSANYTTGGIIKNRENTNIIRLKYVVKKYRENFNTIWDANK